MKTPPFETAVSCGTPVSLHMPESMFSREILRIESPALAEGNVPGHKVRHPIDGRQPEFTDPFLVLAEDWMPRGAFPVHPHRGMETVTLVIEGCIEHRDSAGNVDSIRAGDAQWMTAGRGVQHEENPPAGTIAHTLQLWVNLPASAKMAEPRYQTLRASALAARSGAGFTARVLSGRSGDAASSTLNHAPVTLVDVSLDAGACFEQRLSATDNAFVYLLSGAAAIGRSAQVVRQGQLAWLTRATVDGPSQLVVTAQEDATRLLVAAGRPLREPIVFGGPFVMNTQAEIRQAFDDFRSGRL